MIEQDIIFDDFMPYAGLWCGADMEPAELAQAAQYAIDNNLSVVSVAPEHVKIMWPWLEKSGVKILSRFYVLDKKITEKNISDVTINIKKSLKNGADGIQLFMRKCGVEQLVEQVYVIKNDLFFNKDLIIGLDIADIEPSDWDELFANLRKFNVAAMTLIMTKDAGKKSLFPGQVYGMLNSWRDENKFDLHFVVGNNNFRIEQVMRITKMLKPDLMQNMRFLVSA